MPTYDYECAECGYTFDVLQRMSDDPLTVCPECQKPSLKRLVGGGIGIIFKGSGFYVNDSRKSKGSSGGSSSASTTTTSETGSSQAKSGDTSSSSSKEPVGTKKSEGSSS